jgi:hypothetical protein
LAKRPTVGRLELAEALARTLVGAVLTKSLKNIDDTNTWTCPVCSQTVRRCAYGCRSSKDIIEKCLLRDHMVDDICIAYLDPRKARELMKKRG